MQKSPHNIIRKITFNFKKATQIAVTLRTYLTIRNITFNCRSMTTSEHHTIFHHLTDARRNSEISFTSARNSMYYSKN